MFGRIITRSFNLDSNTGMELKAIIDEYERIIGELVNLEIAVADRDKLSSCFMDTLRDSNVVSDALNKAMHKKIYVNTMAATRGVESCK